MALEKLVICDIDGCLSKGRNVPFDLGGLVRLRGLIDALRAHRIGFTLCTGRPRPYVEALAQVLNVTLPTICEGGCLVFYPVSGDIRSLASVDVVKGVHALRNVFSENPVLLQGLEFEVGKESSVSLTSDTFAKLSHEEKKTVMTSIRAGVPPLALSWTYSSSAIDITPSGIDKASGVDVLLAELGMENKANVWGIGDGQNDVPFLREVGHCACPANAVEDIKAMAEIIAGKSFLAGTLELIRKIIEFET